MAMTSDSQDFTRSELAQLEEVLGLSPKSGGASSRSLEKYASVSYLRVSTKRQTATAKDVEDDGNSIAAQRQATRQLSNELQAPILKEFIDPGVSAQSIEKRAEFKELLEFVRVHREVKYVLIYMRHRAFRNAVEATLTKHMLRGMNIEIKSAREKFGNGPEADAMEGMTDILNELQVRKNGQDVSDKMLFKVQRGGSVGRARLGYLNTRTTVDGYLVNTIGIDPKRAPLIQWAFKAYATGEFSVVQLLEELTAQGLTTRPTRRWSEKAISDSQLYDLLRDPYYAGYIRYKGAIYKGRHEPLISVELFKAVQATLEYRSRRTQKDRIHNHYLRGMLACRRCKQHGHDRRLVYTISKGNGGSYPYYICTGRSDVGCDIGNLPVKDVEAAVFKYLMAYGTPKGVTDNLRRQFQALLADAETSRTQQVQNYRKQLKELALREENLLNLVADGSFDSPMLRVKLQEVALGQVNLRERLRSVDSELEAGMAIILLYADLLDAPADRYQHASDTNRRRILDSLFKDLRVGREKATDLPIVEGTLRSAPAMTRELMLRNHLKCNHPRQDTGGESNVTISKTTCCGGVIEDDLVGPTGIEPMTSTV